MKKIALLGEVLRHSLSPEIHSYFADYSYSLLELTPGGLEDFFDRDMDGLDGVNVTIPYKKAVMRRCSVSPEAEAIGAVNTIVRRDGRLVGFNTDCFGFEYMLSRAEIEVGGRRALVLGSGGASATAVYSLRRLGADSVTVISRSGPDNYGNLERHADAELIVNATPVGMFPDNGGRPLDLARFPGCDAVADMIYNPLKTELLADAEARGMRTTNGLPMLAAQGWAASRLFLGDSPDVPDTEAIERAIAGVRRGMLNLVLIGMPGCGKTTAGRELARLTGRTFIDTDEELERAAGESCGELILSRGEAAFRELESAAVGRASKLLGRVIAVGGGAPLSEINRRLLGQNGLVIYIRRKTRELPTSGRPLSVSLEEMLARRGPVYERFAALTVEAGGSPRETAERILSALETGTPGLRLT